MADYTKKEYEAYVNAYPDLAAKRPANMSVAEWGEHHYTEHGSKNKNRKNPEQASFDAKAAQRASTVHAASSGVETFPGSTIPLNIPGLSAEQVEDFSNRLQADINDGNWRSANDILFSIAYAAGGNQGQGNPNVGAVQSGVWKLTDPNSTLWAENYINSDNDEYRLRNATGELTGEVVRFSDADGVVRGVPTTTSRGRGGTEATGNQLKDAAGNVISGANLTAGLDAINSWGGNAKAQITAGQPVTQPDMGDKESIWESYGNDPGWETYFSSDPSLGGASILWPKEGQDKNVGGANLLDTNVTDSTPGSSTMNMLAFSPGTKQYWDTYMGPQLRDSLMKYQPPELTPTPLSYLPGEQRDQLNWEKFLGMGGLGTKTRALDNQFQGAIPQGLWLNDPQRYRALTQDRTVGGTSIPGYAGAPWQFAAPTTPTMTQPTWTAPNVTPAAYQQMSGLLGDWAAPALNTTNLLGVA